MNKKIKKTEQDDMKIKYPVLNHLDDKIIQKFESVGMKFKPNDFWFIFEDKNAVISLSKEDDRTLIECKIDGTKKRGIDPQVYGAINEWLIANNYIEDPSKELNTQLDEMLNHYWTVFSDDDDRPQIQELNKVVSKVCDIIWSS